VLGDADSYSGFFADGELYVGPHNLTVHDRNVGVLGSLTEIGDDSGLGTLSAPNGLLLENGKTLHGYGVVNHAFENQGHVVGEGPLPADELELTGDVTGSGSFDGNIRFSGTYSPGNSPAEIPFGGNVTFAPSATLYVEIGGPTAGAEFDRLDVTGQAQLGGGLVVSLVDDYVPGAGDAFEIVGAGSGVLGTFATESLPALPPDHVWKVDYSPDAMKLEVELPSTTHMQAVLRAADTGLPADPGEAETLPESLQWVDEWDSCWIEIWGRTPDTTGYGIGSFSVDLVYNTDLFTAATIEYGPAFTEDQPASIDDATGRVDNINGSTSQTVGDKQNVLLARVSFEAAADDPGALHNAQGQYITPLADPALSLLNVSVGLVDSGPVAPILGEPPDTKVWPVMYDIDDDGRVAFGDLAFFATAFQQQVGGEGADFAWASDFDRSARVDFGDLAFFAANFGRLKTDDVPLVYPANFPDDWEPAGLQGSFPDASPSPAAPSRLDDAALAAYLGANTDGASWSSGDRAGGSLYWDAALDSILRSSNQNEQKETDLAALDQLFAGGPI
jgi:hypothetical protein